VIAIRGKTYVCSACGWQHEEIDAAESLGSLINIFSDPAQLRSIMHQQSAERVAAAIQKHETDCPGRKPS
jgi:hypothetical protein